MGTVHILWLVNL